MIVYVHSRPADDSDYDEEISDDDVIDDVSSGRIMTCTGLVEMPKYVPRGETFNNLERP